MKYLRAIRHGKPAVLTLFAFALLMGFEGCAPLLVIEYDSDVGNRNAIRARANISVGFKEYNLYTPFRNAETKQSIVDAVMTDLQRNIFYFGEKELDVFVRVEKLSYRETPWLTAMTLPVFPVWFLGFPCTGVTTEAQVSLEIQTMEGVFVSSYQSGQIVKKWCNIYKYQSGNPGAATSKGGFPRDALKLALEDIKKQIIADKERINRAIQEIESVPEPEELPPVTQSRPKVQAGATNIAVMDLDAFAISAPEALALTNRLRVELFNTGRFVILERGGMQDILKEQGFQETGCTTTDCLVEVGQLLNVQHMVAGSVSKVGDVYSIEVRIIDVGTGEIMAAAVEDITGSLGDLLTRGIRNAALKLVQ
ncbi:hypothetical protein ES703_05547 [subsurface metagenome]